MNKFRIFTNSLFIRPEKSITHWVTSVLIFSFVMMPFVHFHPAVQLFENGKAYTLQGRVDFLSFSEGSVATGTHGIAKEITEAPEIKHLFKTKRNKKLDFFLTKTTYKKLSSLEGTTSLYNGVPNLIARKNHYHFTSSTSPPVSLA